MGLITSSLFQFPLEPGASASLTLYLPGVIDFVIPSSRHGKLFNKIDEFNITFSR